ncbi:small integral membrane protein-protein [Staphylococcus aureus]|uniref:Small integral membrane protein-protein n=1 Tax=Staphylococcus aureus TaxID=1280 RepID=A0A2X2JUS5_STAAU|nr:small integral membrane protein-protein [Staphylococcus aureus]
MANNHNQNGQDSTQQVINFLKVFKMENRWFLSVSINRDIILNVRFWKTILIIVLCLIGVGIGYMKDRKQDFMNFLNRWS